jgi:hypothetical protein
VANDLARPAPPGAASELAAFADPSALGDYLDFVVFMASARKARESRGLTVSEVAERMGASIMRPSRGWSRASRPTRRSTR